MAFVDQVRKKKKKLLALTDACSPSAGALASPWVLSISLEILRASGGAGVKRE